ncbi:hypothetical protein [Bradyrhizobium sp.]|uniref:hypothetical protein n=1 Tax=Bradyrhizobium sp. TaxID=376 RepID=UPI003C7553BC
MPKKGSDKGIAGHLALTLGEVTAFAAWCDVHYPMASRQQILTLLVREALAAGTSPERRASSAAYMAALHRARHRVALALTAAFDDVRAELTRESHVADSGAVIYPPPQRIG